MAAHSEKFLSPAEMTTFTSPNRYFQPELSEDPIFSKFSQQHSGFRKRQLEDNGKNSETHNSSSLQISTQQSLNFKKSFFMASPKRSVQSTPFLLANKGKELQEMSLTMKLRDKLRGLEEEELTRKSENLRIMPLLDYNEDSPMSNLPVESHFIMEGEDNLEIPHLRWCPSCQAENTTEVIHVNSNVTFWSSVGIFLVGGIFGCFLVPYMTNYCKDIRVICHICKRKLN